MANFVRKSTIAALKKAADELESLPPLGGEESSKEDKADDSEDEDLSDLDEEDDELPTALQGEDFDFGSGLDTDESDEEDRQTSPMMLNQLLADLMVLFVKTFNYHWCIQGPNFEALHAMLGVQYETLVEMADSTAERIRALGEFPTAYMDGWLDLTKLEEAETTERRSKDMLEDLVRDYSKIAANIKKYNKVMLEELDDQGTSDFILGMLYDIDKKIWMLKSSTRDL